MEWECDKMRHILSIKPLGKSVECDGRYSNFQKSQRIFPNFFLLVVGKVPQE
jgi:hypothetical protein